MRRNDLFISGRRAPEEYQSILTKYGKNLYNENLYRVVWGPSRCYWVGGYWEIEDEFSYRKMPKYGVKNQRWMVEKWIPASTYGSPSTWETKTLSKEGFLQIGPFPVYGEYECASIFSVGAGPAGYVPLEPGTVDLQTRLIHNGRTTSLWDIRNNNRTEQEMKVKEQDRNFDDLWDSVQMAHKGLTIGPTGHYNGENALNEYKARLLQNKDSWGKEKDLVKGFGQDEELLQDYLNGE